MKKIIAYGLVTMLVLLAGTKVFDVYNRHKIAQQQQQAKREATQFLQNKIVSTLKDPASVQWRNERLTNDNKTMCGEVNAKNSLGGYVGFKRYIANREGYLVEGEPFRSWAMSSNKTPVPDHILEGAQLSDSGQQIFLARDVFNFFWNSNCS